MEPYDPVNDNRNNALAEEYRKLAEKEEDVIFGGRLGLYKYFDMAPVIAVSYTHLDVYKRQADILETYGEFEKLSRTVKIMDTVKLMKRVVPEFKRCV